MEMPAWKLLETLDSAGLRCLDPRARYWAGHTQSAYGFELGRRRGQQPLVTLGIDSRQSSIVDQFSDDGRLLAWGNADGTVLVCDIQAVRHKLAEVGLGWE